MEIRAKKEIVESLYGENTQDDEKPEENPGYFDTLNVPYIAGFSERLSRELRRINIGVTFSKGKILYKDL